jgi:Tfp pilus assembly protein FimT
MTKQRTLQRGVSLSGLLVAGVIVAIVAVLGMKIVPDVIEYFQVKSTINAIAHDGNLASVADVRNAFNRYADIDQISSVNGNDLEVVKSGSGFAVSIAYERRIHLFGPASLVLDFEASSGS